MQGHGLASLSLHRGAIGAFGCGPRHLRLRVTTRAASPGGVWRGWRPGLGRRVACRALGRPCCIQRPPCLSFPFPAIERLVLSLEPAAAVVGMIKLALPAGKASPAPPVGPALGQKQVNIMQFCKEYNAATADKAGMIIPVEITVYKVRTSATRGVLGPLGLGRLGPPTAHRVWFLGWIWSEWPCAKPSTRVHAAPRCRTKVSLLY